MRIRAYLISILIVAALGGLAVAGAINANFSQLQIRGYEVSRNSLALTHLDHLTSSMEQMLITADLVIGSGETYLAEGLYRQISSLRKELAELQDFSLLNGVSEQLARADTLLENIVANSQLQIQNLDESGKVSESIVSAYDDAAQYLAALTESLYKDAGRAAQIKAERLAEDQIKRGRLATFLAALYVVLIILVLRWSLSRIANPLQQLTIRAEDAMELNRRFRFDASGPAEIFRLGNTIDRFVGSLEDRVEERTIDLKRKTLELQREIEVRKETETELNRAKLAAEAATRAKSDFLSVVSHELRTPLNAVLGTIDLLKDSDLNAEQRVYADHAQQSGNTLLTLLNDVLDMSKIEAGHMTLAPVSLRVDEIIDSVIELFNCEAIGKGLVLAGMIAPDTPLAVRGDPVRIRQILINLVSNAIKFTDHGHVHLKVEPIRAQEGRQELRFEVIDTGIGIDPQHRDQVFAEFSQLDSSHTRRQGGTGLGLAICKRLVKMMGGHLNVESTVGSGSRFWFSLPLMEGSDLNPSDNEMAGFVRSQLANTTVAVLGNDPRLTDCVTQMISPWIETQIIRSEAELMRSASVEDQVPIVVVCGQTSDGEWLDAGRRFRERFGAHIRLLAVAPGTTRASIYAETKHIFDVSQLNSLQPMALLKAICGNDTSSQSSERLGQQTTGSGHVLIVEDSKANSLIASEILSKAGYAVDTVENGELAVTAAQNNTYDIILMDLQMPVMDGYDATAAIRSLHPPVCDVPVVALTANVMAESEAATRAIELDGFLSKPLLKQDLLDAVQHWTVIGRERRHSTLTSRRRTNSKVQTGLS